MQFVIPEGAQVHITIGAAAPVLALPGPAAAATPVAASKHPMVKGVLALCLVAGAFQAGRYLPSRPVAASATHAVDQADPQPEDVAPLAIPQAPSAASGIPADFREQLARQPRIVPPPGQPQQPAGAPAPPNPFGLQG